MAYKFYIAGKLLPVPPPTMTITINNQNERVSLVDDGEINIIKRPGLKEFSFEILLPAVEYPFASYETSYINPRYGTTQNVTPPIEYLELFQTLKNERLPFQLDIYRELPNGEDTWYTNETVTLEDYEVTEDAEDGCDVRVSLNFCQYKDYGTQIVILNADGVTYQTVRADEKRIMRVATAQEGDTYYTIACREFGSENVNSDVVRYLEKINRDPGASDYLAIENAEEWQDDQETIRGNFLALIDKTFGGASKYEGDILPGNHWAEKHIVSLYKKNILGNNWYWALQAGVLTQMLDESMTIGGVLEICDSVSGGTLDIYVDAVYADYRENFLNSLVDKGLIFEREKWEDFDGNAVNSNVKALVRKCAELCEAYGILSEGQTVKLTDDSYGTYDEWLAGNSG